MEEKEERRDRIVFLRRQAERGRKIAEMKEWLPAVGCKSEFDNDVLTIEEMDDYLIALNSSDFDFNYLNFSYPDNKIKDLENIVRILKPHLNKINLFGMSQWTDVAILRTNTSFIHSQIQKLLEIEGDTFYIYDMDVRNGLWIDFYEEYWYLDGEAKLRPIYELRVFGKEWMKIVAAEM